MYGFVDFQAIPLGVPSGRIVRPAPSRAPPAFRGHEIVTPQPGHGLSRKDPRTPVPSCSSDSDDSPPRRAHSPDGAGSPPRRPPPSSGEDSPPADEGGASPPRMRSVILQAPAGVHNRVVQERKVFAGLKNDRLAILVSCGDKDQLIGVPIPKAANA
ncbi:Putative surface-exposed virulence protein BigA [Frankliniella fusca]|uniref:Surface-exposed virulence protein BigA n=1 Tax=Frankliniella fusca TaxID=407009 RepID=A0AAE1LE62_9NEOP|nr:Putative surface-exposed virulence protein BigA [Frankliniella fusca]